MNIETDKQMADDIKIVLSVLKQASEYNLEVEVVFTALQSMKHHPKQTVSEAILTGLHEWVK